MRMPVALSWNCHYWSIWWPVTWSAPTHHINQCCLAVDWPIFQQVINRKLPQKNRPSLVHMMACRPIGLHWLGLDIKDPGYSRYKGKPPMTMVSPHQGTILWKMREITNVLSFAFKIVYHFASSVQLMTLTVLHVLEFHPLERLRWSLAWISSLPMGASPSYLFWWQLMWWVTTDVAVSVCGRFGLWPFRSVAGSVCGRPSLWPFRFVAVSVCGHFGLWPFRLWPFRLMAVMTCYHWQQWCMLF